MWLAISLAESGYGNWESINGGDKWCDVCHLHYSGLLIVDILCTSQGKCIKKLYIASIYDIKLRLELSSEAYFITFYFDVRRRTWCTLVRGSVHTLWDVVW